MMNLWLVDQNDNDVARIVDIRTEITVLILSDKSLHLVDISDQNRYQIYYAETPEELLENLSLQYSFD